MRMITFTAAVSLAVLSTAALAATKPEPKGPVLATPPGVTLQSARAAGGGGMAAAPTLTVYADAMGKTLYTFDKDTVPGKSACVGECVAAWPPLAAPARSAGGGVWSVITRDDGTLQWALKGKPLYTFVKDENIGDAKGANVADLWRTAAFKPVDGVAFPEGINAEELVNASGWALVNTRRLTLYTLDGDTGAAKTTCAAACLDTWTPLAAPEVANSVGEFAPLSRGDGIRQWTWRGKPLYAFAGDAEPGDVNGEGKDKKWHAAVAVSYFNPANVAITHNPRHGTMLATAAGMTLYARDANRFTGGGASHADRTIARGTPATGRAIGVKGCDAACTENWKPFTPSATDQPSGYWTITTRDNGTRQWVYLGYPLYTYVKDTAGTARGHDIYDLSGKVPGPPEAAQLAGAQALYWRVALP